MQVTHREIWTLARHEKSDPKEAEKPKEPPLRNIYEFEADETRCPLMKDYLTSLFNKYIAANPSKYYEVGIQIKDKTVSVCDGPTVARKCFQESTAYNTHGVLFFIHHPEKDRHKDGVPNRVFIFKRISASLKDKDTQCEELLKTLALLQDEKPELQKIKEAEATIKARDTSEEGFPSRVFLFVTNPPIIELRSRRDALISEANTIKEEYIGKEMPEHLLEAITVLERTLNREKGKDCSIL